MLSFPSNNITTGCYDYFNNTDSNSICFRNAKCEFNKFAQYNVCTCPPYYDPISKCEKSIFEVYEGKDLIYTSIGFIIYSIYFILFLLELIVDFRLGVRNVLMISKFSLLLFNITRIGHFSIWTYASIYGIFDSLSVIDTVLRNLAILFLGVLGYFLVCISWLNLLLKAKNLGQQTKKIKIFKIIIIITLCIISPIAIAMNIAISIIYNNTDINIKSIISALELISNIIGFIGIFVPLIITFYLQIIIYIWLNKLNTDFKSKRVSKVRIKTRYLISMNISLIFILISIGIFSLYPREIPFILLILNSVTRLIELFVMTTLFGFLQSYFYHNKLFLGYYYGILGKLKSIELTSTPPSNSNKDIITQPKNSNTDSSILEFRKDVSELNKDIITQTKTSKTDSSILEFRNEVNELNKEAELTSL